MAENNDALKGSTMKVFGSVRQNLLDRNSWYSPFLSIDFCNAARKGYSTKRVGTVRQKNFEGNLDTSPYLLSINISATRKILKHSTEGFLYGLLLYCETNNFRWKILILAPSYPLTFSLTESFWNTAQKGYSTNCFGTVRQNVLEGKSWHNPWKHNIFQQPKLMTY